VRLTGGCRDQHLGIARDRIAAHDAGVAKRAAGKAQDAEADGDVDVHAVIAQPGISEGSGGGFEQTLDQHVRGPAARDEILHDLGERVLVSVESEARHEWHFVLQSLDRVQAVLPRFQIARGAAEQFHVPAGEHASGCEGLFEDFDGAMAWVAADRTPDLFHSIGRALERLEVLTILVDEHAGDAERT
jgi:hypothetical protein